MKKRFQEIKDAQIRSVQYVHDPEAVKKYHALFMEVVQKVVDEEITKRVKESI